MRQNYSYRTESCILSIRVLNNENETEQSYTYRESIMLPHLHVQQFFSKSSYFSLYIVLFRHFLLNTRITLHYFVKSVLLKIVGIRVMACMCSFCEIKFVVYYWVLLISRILMNCMIKHISMNFNELHNQAYIHI